MNVLNMSIEIPVCLDHSESFPECFGVALNTARDSLKIEELWIFEDFWSTGHRQKVDVPLNVDSSLRDGFLKIGHRLSIDCSWNNCRCVGTGDLF